MTEVEETAVGREVETVTPVTSLPAVQELPIPASAVAAAPAAPVNRVTQVRRTVGEIVPYAHYQLTRLGAVGVTGIVTLLVAVAITVGGLIPGHSAIRALDADIARAVQHRFSEPTQEEGLGKLVSALPTRGQIPAVIGQVLQQAQRAGVSLEVGHYAFIPAKAGSVGRYEFEFPLHASYPQVRDFINRTLTAVPAAGLDKLRIERKSVADQAVNADVRFVVFVRGE